MNRSTILPALLAAIFLPGFSVAEESVGDPAAAANAVPVADAELEWDQFDDPSFDPVSLGTTETATASETAPADSSLNDEPTDEELLGSVPVAQDSVPQIRFDADAPSPSTSTGNVVLGPRGVDDLGRAGRLHTVARGDTLWDLAAAYLGTPWVWPSVWIDNDDIENPHEISPGEKIWITANEMRVVTDEEAESFIAPVAVAETEVVTEVESAMPFEGSAEIGESVPVAAFDDSNEDLLSGVDEPSTLEAFPVAIAASSDQGASRGRRVTVSRRESMGFVSADSLAGSSTIVGSPIERVFVATGDDVILGVGEGDVEIGDQFSIFKMVEDVRDPESRRLLGHHVEPLGWVEVKELTGDTSIGEVRTSYSEIPRGARIIVRNPVPRTVEVRSTPDAIEGKIVFLPSERTLMADGGYVYLNRGEFHGIETGSELEVFEGGSIVTDHVRSVDVRTPDQVVARLVVVSVEADSSVAFVLWAKRELIVGDSVRPTIPTLAQR